MGHSASIAKKYSPNKESHPKLNPGIETETANEDEELASVSSYRPTSPVAHSDARSFVLDGQHGSRLSNHSSRDLVPYRYREPRYNITMNGSVPSHASSSQMSQLRSMRDVRDFIRSNPELLVGKKQRNAQKTKVNGFTDIGAPHKQIKTKQRVYLSLINPPIIYAMGAQPDDRQLRVNQNVYLNLVYPSQDRRQYYHEQAMRSRSPLKYNDMVVIRRDDYFKQKNGQIRPRLPQLNHSQPLPQQKALPELSHKSKMPTPQTVERTLALTTAPRRSRQPLPPPTRAQQKGTNGYVAPPVTKTGPPQPQSQSLRGQAAKQRSRNWKENGNGVLPNHPQPKSMTRHGSHSSHETVEFTFNLEDLNLRKKSQVAQFEKEKDKGKVVPLYFRKSLAYSPKYIEDDGLLSSPL